MTRATRAQTFASRKTSIQSLPRETLSHIMEEIAKDPKTGRKMLVRCARVCKSWTDVAFKILFRHVRLEVSPGILECKAFGQHRVESLHVINDVELDSKEWEAVVSACQGLVELIVELDPHQSREFGDGDACDEYFTKWPPATIFKNASLAPLKRLTLKSHMNIDGPITSAFQLEHLGTDSRSTQLPLLREILNSTSVGTLTSLEFHPYPVVPTYAILHMFNTIASNIQHLHLWQPLQSALEDHNRILSFLPLTSSLAHLHLSAKDSARAEPFVVSVLQTLVTSLSKLSISALSPNNGFSRPSQRGRFSPSGLDGIWEALQEGTALVKLVELRFPTSTLKGLRKLDQWARIEVLNN